MSETKKTKKPQYITVKEMNMPMVIGECTKCHRGERSMVIMNYIKNERNEKLNMLKLKCIACFKEQYKYLSEITQ